MDELRLGRKIARLNPLEVRYHCAFKDLDLGDEDSHKAETAMEIFKRICRLVSDLDGRFMTVHLGLGRDSTHGLSWDRTLRRLADLVQFGEKCGVSVCLENLAYGWTSRPELFEKLIRKSGCKVTLDIGHARVCSSVESERFYFEDFILPHAGLVMNAHVYHEEREDSHVPPSRLEDVLGRLTILRCLSCDWWTLELREEEALLSTLKVVREFLDSAPSECSLEALS